MPSRARSWLAVIPARSGSAGVRSKNLRTVAGVPLVVSAITRAMDTPAIGPVVVATDCDDTAALARLHGAHVHRTDGTATAGPTATVADVVADVLRAGPWRDGKRKAPDGGVVALQPTSPLLRWQSVQAMLDKVADDDLDSAATVRSVRHLHWTDAGPVWPEPPANRQALPDRLWAETGGAQATREFPARGGPRSGWPMRGGAHHLHDVGPVEGLDIDTPDDLAAADRLARTGPGKRRAHFMVDAGERQGSGHVRRALLLAHAVADHLDVTFGFLDGVNGWHGPDWAVALLARYGYANEPGSPSAGLGGYPSHLAPPDVVVTDCLEGDALLLRSLAQAAHTPVVALEATGLLAQRADVVVNELLAGPDAAWCGPRWAVFPPALEYLATTGHRPERGKRPRVLVTFGGTDPAGLTAPVTRLVAEALEDTADVEWVAPPGWDDVYADTVSLSLADLACTGQRRPPAMWEAIAEADLVVTSAGRTTNEAAAAGTPCLSLAVNAREATHRVAPGVWHLGAAPGAVPHVGQAAAMVLADGHTAGWMARTAGLAVGSGGRQAIADAILQLAWR